MRRAGDWDAIEGGRTLHIGTRGNKLLRGYDKGKQFGRKDGTWFRVELEWRGKNRVIPREVLEHPGDDLVGAFPCLAFPSERQEKIHILQCGAEISVETMTREARRFSGKAVNVLMDMCEGDAAAVVKLLRREGVPKRLRPWAEGVKHLESS